MTIRRVIRYVHLWLGLLLGAQLLLWVVSGVVMSWFHITLVRGETNMVASYPAELEISSYANPGGAIAQTPGATSVKLKRLLERPVYEVASSDGAALFDARTGAKISPISEEMAQRIARRDFAGAGDIKQIELMNAPPHEYRGTSPVWRVSFDDDLKTRIYISPSSGEIEARRNKIWRLYDFFWMLHIMDYEERENFNNPLVRAASATGFLFVLTGLFLVISRLVRGQYRMGVKQGARSADPRRDADSPDS